LCPHLFVFGCLLYCLLYGFAILLPILFVLSVFHSIHSFPFFSLFWLESFLYSFYLIKNKINVLALYDLTIFPLIPTFRPLISLSEEDLNERKSLLNHKTMKMNLVNWRIIIRIKSLYNFLILCQHLQCRCCWLGCLFVFWKAENERQKSLKSFLPIKIPLAFQFSAHTDEKKKKSRTSPNFYSHLRQNFFNIQTEQNCKCAF
jgi:hypothetical protein